MRYTNLKSRLPLVALVVAIGAVVYTLPEGSQKSDPVLEQPETAEMVVIGPGPLTDPCTVEIHASAHEKMIELGIEKWQSACAEAQARAE
jgi:hypothetical protein